MGLKNAVLAYQEYNSEYTQNLFKKLDPFPLGFHNMATSNQARSGGFLDPVLRMPLKGAQEGLVLTITPQDCIVHWPGSVPEDSSTRLVDTMTKAILSYQKETRSVTLKPLLKLSTALAVRKSTTMT